MKEIKVSVSMIAYNIEPFIGQAIESILMQKTNFPLQLVIGENLSPDGTRDICIAYKKKYPDRIKLLLHEKNLGLTANSIATQNACDGKYIAMCDGDDYWTDPYKLQTQVDFLESHPEYAGSGHQATVIYDDNSREPHNFRGFIEADLYMKDVIELRKFHTSSLVYKTSIWKKYGGIPHNIHANDRAMYLMIATEGMIRYFDKAMCIYRKNDSGISSSVNISHLKKDFNIIPWITKINPAFPKNRYKAYIHKTIIEYPERVSFFSLLKHYFLHVWYSFSYFPENRHEMRGSLRIFIKKFKKNFKNA